MRAHLLLLILLIPKPAGADSWVAVEAPFAVAASDAQSNAFRPGVMPAVAAYTENELFALGVRLRGGVLSDGPAPGGGLADPALGGVMTASVAIRVPIKRAWVEAAFGGGITGHDIVPAFELGVGWAFALGKFDVGPSLRYMRLTAKPMDTFGSADLALLGVDVRFGRQRPERALPPPRVAPKPIPVPDPIRVVEHSPPPPPLLPPPPPAGETLAEGIVLENDRIVLEERVLFRVNRSEVGASGKNVLAALAKVWRAHPDWKHITVEGHADATGTTTRNQQLSEERAGHVKAALVSFGCADVAISVVGYGTSRIRDAGTDEGAHARNRRVEFVIDRSVP
ncbi:MAG: OmpA family protein [Deltaproteobacteria bacterium]|nr:OmpA family protein [Deltaproteobacteria bacterium]